MTPKLAKPQTPVVVHSASSCYYVATCRLEQGPMTGTCGWSISLLQQPIYMEIQLFIALPAVIVQSAPLGMLASNALWAAGLHWCRRYR